MNSQTDSELLRAYAEERSDEAFAELVRRHVDLVYSAALRMVHSSHLAQDVTQGVFVALAKNAVQLSERPVLSGWLHRTARNIAAQTVRTEVRRRTREQEAAAMGELLSDQPEAIWSEVAPLLDAALDELSDADREAVLLRYFERKSATEVAQLLGIGEEAAQKRVSRAVERLREYFARNGVAVGTSGLVLCISANAVQAAPAGLVATVSTAATLAGTVIASTTTATVIGTLAMTTLQKAIVTTVIAATAGMAIYQTREVSILRKQNQALLQQQASRDQQNEQAQNSAAPRSPAPQGAPAKVRKTPSEVSKLRAQVGELRQENASIKSKSALSKGTADPDARKAMREQQKMGMGALYAELTKRLKLSPEQTGQFNDLLADQVMDSIDLITQALHDHASGAETDLLFAAQDSVMHEKVSTLVGPDGLAQYKDYTKNLLNTLTVSQFANKFTGEMEARTEKRQRLLQAMQEESQSALAAAGLPGDYLTVPLLNFRNIASEELGERSLSLMQDIYNGAATRAISFLTTDEVTKFKEFAKTGIEQNRAALLMNRKLMAPIAQ